MSDVITIAPMRPRHLPEVLEIERLVYPRPWSERLFADELGRSRRAYVVARLGDAVVGYGGLLMIAEDGHVATVAVHPDHQRQGVARAVLVGLVRRALELGAEQLTLEVRVTNRGAQDLYRQFGFVPGGARKAYYADNGEDALVMWAHDICTDAYLEQLQALEAAGPRPIAWAPWSDGTPSHPALAGPAPRAEEAS